MKMKKSKYYKYPPHKKESRIKEQVEYLMEKDTKTRNSDTYLILKFWMFFNNIKKPTPRDYSFVTNPASIIRARRYIQNTKGILLPTDPSVAYYRKLREELFRKEYGNQAWKDFHEPDRSDKNDWKSKWE